MKTISQESIRRKPGALLVVLIALNLFGALSGAVNGMSSLLAGTTSGDQFTVWNLGLDVLSIVALLGIVRRRLRAAYAYVVILVLIGIPGVASNGQSSSTILMAVVVLAHISVWLLVITKTPSYFA